MEAPFKKDGDEYAFELPGVKTPLKASMRFLHGYAYFAVSTEKIDSKQLLEPKALFDETEKAAVTIRIRGEKLPDDLRKAASEYWAKVLNFMTLGPLHLLLGLGGQEMLLLAGGTLAIFAANDDVLEIVWRLDLNPKTGSFVYELAAEPKMDSFLAKKLSAMRPTRNNFAQIVDPDCAVYATFQAPLFSSEIKSLLLKGVDTMAKQAAAESKGVDYGKDEAVAAAAATFKALRQTIEDENLDLAIAVKGPDSKGRFTGVGRTKACATRRRSRNHSRPCSTAFPKRSRSLPRRS